METRSLEVDGRGAPGRGCTFGEPSIFLFLFFMKFRVFFVSNKTKMKKRKKKVHKLSPP